MANSKISALPLASTPLAGTEVLAVVQGGITEQVSVANLTAGRAVSANSMTLTTALAATSGGTGSTSAFVANAIPYASSTTVLSTSANLTYDGTNAVLLNGKLGIGTASLTANLRIRSLYNLSDAATTASNLFLDGTHTLTANNAITYTANEGQAAIAQGAFNQTTSLASGGGIRGYRAFTTVTGASGTVTAATGFLADVRNTGAGTLTNAAGFVTSFTNSGGGTLTNTYGYYAGAATAGTNNYGFYGNLASGTGVYNLYMAGTAENYLAGGLTIGRTAVTSPATTDGNVFSGTYTPTLFNTTNVAASTAYECQYLRVGNTVTVSGQVDIDPTLAAIDTVLGMSLPIASALAATRQLGGAGAITTPGRYGEGTAISADLTNDRAQFLLRPSSVNNSSYNFSFTYRVL